MNPTPKPFRNRLRELEWPVWATVIVALLLGLLVERLDVNRTRTVAAGNTRLSYPTGWSRTREDGAVFAASDISRGGGFGPRVSVREVPKEQLLPPANSAAGAGFTLRDVATGWSVTRSGQLVAYRVLDTKALRLHGRDAQAIDYAYASGSTEGSTGAAPEIVRARDVVVDGGNQYEILTFAATNADYQRLTGQQFPLFRNVQSQVANSWQLP